MAPSSAGRRASSARPPGLAHVDPCLIGGEQRRRGEEEQLIRHQLVDAAVAGEGVVAGPVHIDGVLQGGNPCFNAERT